MGHRGAGLHEYPGPEAVPHLRLLQHERNRIRFITIPFVFSTIFKEETLCTQ